MCSQYYVEFSFVKILNSTKHFIHLFVHLYMSPGGGGINTPAFIGDITSIVAYKLRSPVEHLLNSTVQNSRQLYGCMIILVI